MQSEIRAMVDPEVRAQLVESARLAAPAECCGALLGTSDFCHSWEVERVLELTNRSSQTETEYLITSDDVRFAQRQARLHGLDVVGFFHSHPNHNVRPSARDLERAWPGYVYVIVSGADASAWTLDEEREAFRAVELTP